MAETETPPEATPEHQIPLQLVGRLKEIDESDFIQFNDDRRTWIVTDVVTQSFDEYERGEKTDPRESQIAIRLRYESSAREQTQVAGLVVDRYPDHAEASVTFLQSDRLGEEGKEVPLESLKTFDAQLEWVVTLPGGSMKKWHRPDPDAALRGEAKPACEPPSKPRPHRYVKRSIIESHYRPCKTCVTEFDADRDP